VLLQSHELESLIASHAASKTKLVIVDCSPEADAYVPGAISLQEAATQAGTWVALKSPDRINVIAQDKFYELLTLLGVDASTTVVAYDSAMSQLAARFLWASSLFGFPDGQVKVLDGGLKNWVLKGMTTSAELEDPVPATARPLNQLQPRTNLLASLSDVNTAVQQKSATMFDLRSPGEFCGLKRLNKRGGHIPSARNLDWTLLVDDQTHTLLPADKLRDKLVRAGVIPVIAPPAGSEKPIITYCQAGGRAAVGYLALKSLGHSHVKMYDASMSEYANRDDTKLEA
jgi:thiosulfate/3-mercaptopyruvate sulfurtransferase